MSQLGKSGQSRAVLPSLVKQHPHPHLGVQHAAVPVSAPPSPMPPPLPSKQSAPAAAPPQRYVVTQTRAAADADDPAQLVARVEALVGTDGYAERIAAADACAASLSQQVAAMEEQASRWEAGVSEVWWRDGWVRACDEGAWRRVAVRRVPLPALAWLRGGEHVGTHARPRAGNLRCAQA